MTPWGLYLREIMDREGLKPAEVARRFGVSHAFLKRVMDGEPQKNADTVYKPPLDRLESWGKALHLEGAELDAFIELGELMNATERIRARFLSMKRFQETFEPRIKRLEDERPK